ncbi:hypothetical protein GGE07_003975 [Sinorhizobium terangae]|uniref:Uncharacterized protein n=1 Tax=Sinorhizobium terangae TaxID=110322 RepID=A0A6N7LAN9_SINTE|nr:hypothetical protein [Sinorhizobium terangae]MBB4187311.1 hypothetical protein [Sinorhizobium terangae]MQX14666.1 hypothetical protein [Sinorhizobium terangae]
MTRYTITVINLSDHNTDPEAVIGYDRRLQTFFLQAFPDAEGEDLALWIGTQYCAFETLTSLRSAARRKHRVPKLQPPIGSDIPCLTSNPPPTKRLSWHARRRDELVVRPHQDQPCYHGKPGKRLPPHWTDRPWLRL